MKQRLIGAGVLVALAVLVLPIFFDGAGMQQEPTVEFTIPPRPEFEPVEPLQPARLPPAEPIPAEPPPAAIEPDEDEVAPPLPAVKTAPAEPPPANADALVAWVVQVGSFERESNALGLREKLRKAGYDAFIKPAGSGANLSYRVRIGPVRTRSDADKLLQRLRDGGHKGIVLQHQ